MKSLLHCSRSRDLPTLVSNLPGSKTEAETVPWNRSPGGMSGYWFLGFSYRFEFFRELLIQIGVGKTSTLLTPSLSL